MSLDPTFTLRPIQPDDSDDLRKLIFDTDVGVLTTEFQVDVYTGDPTVEDGLQRWQQGDLITGQPFHSPG